MSKERFRKNPSISSHLIQAWIRRQLYSFITSRHEIVDSCTVSLPHTEAHSKCQKSESTKIPASHLISYRHEIVDSCTVSLFQDMKSLTVVQFQYLILKPNLSVKRANSRKSQHFISSHTGMKSSTVVQFHYFKTWNRWQLYNLNTSYWGPL